MILYHSMVNQFSLNRSSTFQAFCTSLKHLNQTINKNLMALLSDILHGLHFHSFITKVTKWKCRNICSFCVYLQKSFQLRKTRRKHFIGIRQKNYLFVVISKQKSPNQTIFVACMKKASFRLVIGLETENVVLKTIKSMHGNDHSQKHHRFHVTYLILQKKVD